MVRNQYDEQSTFSKLIYTFYVISFIESYQFDRAVITKYHPLGLKQQTHISQLWRTEVQTEDVGRFGFS